MRTVLYNLHWRFSGAEMQFYDEFHAGLGGYIVMKVEIENISGLMKRHIEYI